MSRRTSEFRAREWLIQRTEPRGVRTRFEISGGPLEQLVEGVVYALAEAAEEGGTRHEAWLDYTLAVYNLRSDPDVDDTEHEDLKHSLARAWGDLRPELDDRLRLTAGAARRLHRALGAVLGIERPQGERV